MRHESPSALARRFFIEQDRLRGGPAEELCAPGYTAHLSGQPTLDLAGHQAFAAAFYAGFPDLRHQIDEVAGDGERAAVRFTLLGTNSEPFLGMPASGRPIAIAARAELQIVGGQVVELWGEFDQAGLLAQLSGEQQATPPPAI